MKLTVIKALACVLQKVKIYLNGLNETQFPLFSIKKYRIMYKSQVGEIKIYIPYSICNRNRRITESHRFPKTKYLKENHKIHWNRFF